MTKKTTITFPDWIRDYGVRKLARQLGVDPSTVSKWLNRKTQPGLDRATIILKLAKGRLSAADLQKGGAA